ncbi:hypothetical protein [Nostoc sp.]
MVKSFLVARTGVLAVVSSQKDCFVSLRSLNQQLTESTPKGGLKKD